MQRKRKKNPACFEDQWVFYRSEEHPEMWVAHSLKTDQVGMDEGLVGAYIALHQALGNLLALAEDDPAVALDTPAPEPIARLAASAGELPAEIVEVAWLRMTGRWPEQDAPTVACLSTEDKPLRFESRIPVCR